VADPSEHTQGADTPLRLRLMARGMSAAISRAPFLWPVLRAPTRRFWERAAARWDEQRGSAERLAPLAAACDRLEPDPRRILELGTGTGMGALALARRFPAAEVVAVDLAERMVAAAQAKLPEELASRVSFRVADAAHLPFPDASFDLVAQLNLPVYADEVARVLRPDGHVIVASSFGPATPYYTPPGRLRAAFARRGIETVAAEGAGRGDFLLARRPGRERR
jgi:SAM-dependent methyltransferase